MGYALHPILAVTSNGQTAVEWVKYLKRDVLIAAVGPFLIEHVEQMAGALWFSYDGLLEASRLVSCIDMLRCWKVDVVSNEHMTCLVF